MNPATFLMMSLAVLAPAAAFIFDHQLQYQQSLEELSAEDTPKRHTVKRLVSLPPSPSSEEDSGENSSRGRINFFGGNSAQEPNSEESDAAWHRTCGSTKRAPRKKPFSSIQQTGKNLRKGIHIIWTQLDRTFQLYMGLQFDELYSDVHRNVEERQYVPTWIPDRGDAVELSNMNVESRDHFLYALNRFDTGLQRFAVAYEQMLADEEDIDRHDALQKTQTSIRQLLCEIEQAMTGHGWSIPPRVPRSIMTPEERRTPDYTRRILRDWGVLLRYGTFLRSWLEMMRRIYPAISAIHGLRV